MQFRKKVLSLAVCAAATGMATGAAWAQQDAELVEEIVIRGMKSSLQSAQDIKRDADTVMDVITASDIGALPDKSVTEALQRVPGVTIERFASTDDPKHYADEGTGVLVRGLDRVRSEINGRGAFSANPWGGLSYEDFPAELLGSVEVIKNQTADVISGGIAGTVNLVTRKPFDSSERLLAFGAKANYGDFREELTPSFHALFADSWETSAGTFGFLIAGTRTEHKSRGDGVGVGNFHSRGHVDTFSYDEWGTPAPGVTAGLWSGPCVPNAVPWGGPECADGVADAYTQEDANNYVPLYEGTALTDHPEGVKYYTPAAFHMSTAENDRTRTGFTTSLQWANLDENIVVTLEHINSKASLEYTERQVGQAAQGFTPELRSSHDWIDDAASGHPRTFDDDGFLTSGIGLGTHTGVPLNYRTRYNFNENTVEDTSLNVVLTPTDRLTMVIDYQRIDSEQVVHNYGMAGQTRGGHVARVSPYFLDLRGSRPTVSYLSDNIATPGWAPDADGNLLVDAEPNLFLGSGLEQEEHNTAKADSFKFDVGYEFDGIFNSIKAGVYYSDKDLLVRNTGYEGWAAIATPWNDIDRVAGAAVNNPNLFERVDFSDYYRGDVLFGAVDSFLFPSADLVRNYADSFRRGCEQGWNGYNHQTEVVPVAGECVQPYVPYADKGEYLRDDEGNIQYDADGRAIVVSDRIEGPFAARNISSSNEQRTEFYVRGDFEFADLAVPIRGNLGLRYVNYKLESTGALVQPMSSVRGSENSSINEVMQRDHKALYDIANGEHILSTVKGTDYSTVLPSLNMNFGVTDDVVVRFGASKGLFFPNLMDTRNLTSMGLDFTRRLQDPNEPFDDNSESESYNPVIALDNVALTAMAGNPYLEPEESINLDLTAEWYFAQAGSVTLGLFHKRLDNIIRNKPFNLDVAYNGVDYDVSAYGPDNTGSGTIRGVEFSYSQFYDFLPGAWSGIGLQFNFTYIDQDGLEDPNEVGEGTLRFAEDGTPVNDSRHTFRVFSGLPLQGYSDKNMNIVGMYEYNDISFRLAYNWRSEYLLTLRESEEYVPAYAKASGHLDGSLYYTINDVWKVGIEGSNLLRGETKTRYQMNQEGVQTDALSFITDRRFALSVRAVF